jgi:hypothetical protein
MILSRRTWSSPVPSRRVAVIFGAALPVTALLLATGAPVQAATATGWNVVFTHHYGAATKASGYVSVIAPTSKDAWAFGGTDMSGATAGAPVAEHWTGGSWRGSALPSGLTSNIQAASADSAQDIWAITSSGGTVLHWTGTWSVADHIPGTGELTGVTAISPADVWVFGGGGATGGLGTWHYDGTGWTQQTGSAVGLERASALSADDIWAIGSTSAPDDSVMHYDGTTWTQVTDSALTGLQFAGILALSPSDIWLTATSQSSSLTGLVLHFNGSAWTSVTLPWHGSPGQLASDGSSGVWFALQSPSGGSYAAHQTGSGQVSRTLIGTSSNLLDVARIPGTKSLWGAGLALTTPGANATIWAHGTP